MPFPLEDSNGLGRMSVDPPLTLNKTLFIDNRNYHYYYNTRLIGWDSLYPQGIHRCRIITQQPTMENRTTLTLNTSKYPLLTRSDSLSYHTACTLTRTMCSILNKLALYHVAAYRYISAKQSSIYAVDETWQSSHDHKTTFVHRQNTDSQRPLTGEARFASLLLYVTVRDQFEAI